MKCSCRDAITYEFRFVCDSTSPYNMSYGMSQTIELKGANPKDAFYSGTNNGHAVGNFWSVQGFRRKGLKRWTKCYVGIEQPRFWPADKSK